MCPHKLTMFTACQLNGPDLNSSVVEHKKRKIAAWSSTFWPPLPAISHRRACRRWQRRHSPYDSCPPWRSEVAAGEEAGTAPRLFEASAPQSTKRGRKAASCRSGLRSVRSGRETESAMIHFNLEMKVLNTWTCKHRLHAGGFIRSLMPELHCEGAMQHDKTSSLTWILMAPFRAMKTKKWWV